MISGYAAYKAMITSLLVDTAYYSGISKVVDPWFGGIGSIVMLHSVLPDDDYLPRENVHTSLSFLEAALIHYLAVGVSFVSLSEALRLVELKSSKRFLAFTFDDGYRDNIHVALPLFKKYNVPLTIYVSNSFVSREVGMDYWWGQLRHFVADNNKADLECIQKSLRMESKAEKFQAYEIIRGLMTSQQGAVREMLTKHITSSEALERDCMNAQEIRQCAKEPLIEIGAHTFSHRPLAAMQESEALSDIIRNKRWLEEITENRVVHFAYPFGDADSCGPREFGLAESAGFTSAVTSRIGNISHRHANRRFDIPRIRFVGPFERISFLECQRHGLVSALQRGTEWSNRTEQLKS